MRSPSVGQSFVAAPAAKPETAGDDCESRLTKLRDRISKRHGLTWRAARYRVQFGRRRVRIQVCNSTQCQVQPEQCKTAQCAAQHTPLQDEGYEPVPLTHWTCCGKAPTPTRNLRASKEARLSLESEKAPDQRDRTHLYLMPMPCCVRHWILVLLEKDGDTVHCANAARSVS